MAFPKGWGVQGIRGLYPVPDIRTLTHTGATAFNVGDIGLLINASDDNAPGPGSTYESVTNVGAYNQNQMPQLTYNFGVYMGKKKASVQTEALAVGETGEWLLYGIFDPFVVNPDGASSDATRGRAVYLSGSEAATLRCVGASTKPPVSVKKLGSILETLLSTGNGGPGTTRTRTLCLFNGYGEGTIPGVIPTLDDTGTVATVVTALVAAGYVTTEA